MNSPRNEWARSAIPSPLRKRQLRFCGEVSVDLGLPRTGVPHLKHEHSSLQCLQRDLLKFVVSWPGPSMQSLCLSSLAAADSSRCKAPPCLQPAPPFQATSHQALVPVLQVSNMGSVAEVLSLPGYSGPTSFPFRFNLGVMVSVKPPQWGVRDFLLLPGGPMLMAVVEHDTLCCWWVVTCLLLHSQVIESKVEQRCLSSQHKAQHKIIVSRMKKSKTECSIMKKEEQSSLFKIKFIFKIYLCLCVWRCVSVCVCVFVSVYVYMCIASVEAWRGCPMP